MEGCVCAMNIWKKKRNQAGLKPGTTRSAGQRLTYWATGAPK